jgi:hypothetical protein
VETVTEPLIPIVETVTEPLLPIVETVTQPLAPVLETVTQPLAPIVDTVTQPVAPILDTVTQPLAPVLQTVTQPLAPVADAVAGPNRALPSLGAPAGSTTSPLQSLAPPPADVAKGTALLGGSSPLALRDSLGGAQPPSSLGIGDLLTGSLASPFDAFAQPSFAGAPGWTSPTLQAPAESGSGPGGLPGMPELPAPLGGASSAGGGSGFGFSIFLALLVCLAAFAVQFYSRLQLPPACWRPTAFVAVIERPG